ncbi:hypothetical protein KEM56_000196 [Ascosphaera pollenicola]|nr:hypothetical protein KEM56_000196 [Ascosphaera pollenicola]
MVSSERRALFKPTVIIHGGAGNIERSRIPPELRAKYQASLQAYLRSTYQLLNGIENDQVENGALNAVTHAVTLLEDDELFNCGRVSVFTSAGTIEMEASVMVTSVYPDTPTNATEEEKRWRVKRGAGVILVRNVKNPIQLAREALLRNGYDGKDGGNMHSQLAGESVEKLAKEAGLEFKPDEYFYTKKRWDEHVRGLAAQRGEFGEEEKAKVGGVASTTVADDSDDVDKNINLYLSQGTVGAVCLDRWVNIAVATSTGGLTNKAPGRVGDTPCFGAGFWAESFDSHIIVDRNDASSKDKGPSMPFLNLSISRSPAYKIISECCFSDGSQSPEYTSVQTSGSEKMQYPLVNTPIRPARRALAVSGTGNGDSFLRVNAARTALAMARFSKASLPDAVTAVSGPGGELQQSAGDRWKTTGEGLGGMIGIEAEIPSDELTGTSTSGELHRGVVTWDFNSGGMFRAWMEEGPNGEDIERVMVFRDEYK